jgi:hypothetical protein
MAGGRGHYHGKRDRETDLVEVLVSTSDSELGSTCLEVQRGLALAPECQALQRSRFRRQKPQNSLYKHFQACEEVDYPFMSR